MAGSKKQRHLAEPKENSSSSDEGTDNGEEQQDMETIEVDFEVRVPEAEDKLGIRNLLQQLFRRTNVDVSDLADLLVEQSGITGIIKEAVDADDMETDDDMDVNFGVFSVVNLTTKKDKKCIEQIRSYLLSNCKDTCSKEDFEKFKNIIENDSKHTGLILSERLINIPAKISVALYANLKNDMKNAVEKKEAYNFGYYVLISKMVECGSGTDKESSVYLNPEEELMAEDAEFSFEFNVKTSQDFGASGGWTDDDDDDTIMKRKVLLLPSSKWDSMYQKLAEEFGPTT